MFRLVALLITKGQQLLLSRGVMIGGGAVVASDLFNLDILRRWALELAPGSDAAALEEASRMAARALGLEGDEVLWPTRRDGNPITPKYLIIDLPRGRAWYSTRYHSFKSVRSANSRGFRRGITFGKRDVATQSQAMGRG